MLKKLRHLSIRPIIKRNHQNVYFHSLKNLTAFTQQRRDAVIDTLHEHHHPISHREFMCKDLDENYLTYLEQFVIGKPRNKWNVVVGMSGGVDSSVAAYICTQKQFGRVISVFMHNWDDYMDNNDNDDDDDGDVYIKSETAFNSYQLNKNADYVSPGNRFSNHLSKNIKRTSTKCTVEKDWRDVLDCCSLLGIETVKRKKFVSEYWSKVFCPALDEYKSGATPNPDVWCNKYIKFDELWKYVREEFNADLLVTGHYARLTAPLSTETISHSLSSSSSSSSSYVTPNLKRARDLSKDQTYFLSMVPGESFQRSWFPLGHFESKKTQIREIAKQLNLPTASKRDSMGICFVGNRSNDFKSFLKEYIPVSNQMDKCGGGKFVTHNGDVINSDKFLGITYYTIGQRINVCVGDGKRWYVYDKNAEDNIVYICDDMNHEKLYCNSFHVRDMYLRRDINELEEICVQIRSTSITSPTLCRIKKAISIGSLDGEGYYKVQCSTPIKAISPGQVAAFYDGENTLCLGAGIIHSRE